MSAHPGGTTFRSRTREVFPMVSRTFMGRLPVRCLGRGKCYCKRRNCPWRLAHAELNDPAARLVDGGRIALEEAVEGGRAALGADAHRVGGAGDAVETLPVAPVVAEEREARAAVLPLRRGGPALAAVEDDDSGTRGLGRLREREVLVAHG